MGETLHKIVLKAEGTRCRIYAPVGAHEDLLAYLVRRLLENGANSSFVNQIVDEAVTPETVAADPFSAVTTPADLPQGPALFEPERTNSKGLDLTYPPTLAQIEQSRGEFATTTYLAHPLLLSEPKYANSKPARQSPTLPNWAISWAMWSQPPERYRQRIDAAKPWAAAPTRAPQS